MLQKSVIALAAMLTLCAVVQGLSITKAKRVLEAPAGRMRVNWMSPLQQTASGEDGGSDIVLVQAASSSGAASSSPIMSFELYRKGAEGRRLVANEVAEQTLIGTATIEVRRLPSTMMTADEQNAAPLVATLPLSAFDVTYPSPLVIECSISLEKAFGRQIEPHWVYAWRVQAKRGVGSAKPSSVTHIHPWSSWAKFRLAHAFDDNSDMPSVWVERKTTENLFRTTFTLPAGFKSAVLYTSGIGAFEAYVNGVRSNDHVLDPGTTDFAAYSLVSVDDVTKLVQPGAVNTLGFMLGNGWYGMPQGYGKTPKLRFELVLDNGTVAAFSSPSTTVMKIGPIVYDSIYNGETYICDLETANWNLPSFNASSWSSAVASATTFAPILVFRDFAAIRVNETLSPVSITTPAAGIQVVDFGREVSGVCEIVVSGAGSITLHHGEILDHYDPGQGKFVYFGNLRSALATDTYTACTSGGSANYTYRPRFTYHGFRFVQINTTGSIKLLSIKAKAFFSNVKPTSTLAPGHPTLATLHQHILWGQTANLMSYPSDCDQRDERLGWMADGWLSSDEAASNYDMHGFYRNWVRVMIADQVNGMVGDVTPYIRYGSRPADPTWGMALPYVANLIWLNYGDQGVLREFYNASLKWVEYLASRESQSGMKNMYAYYGDWVPPPPAAKATNSFVSAFSVVYSTQLVLDMAFALNNTKDVPMLQSQLESFLGKFKAAWFNQSTKTFDIGVQTTFALPMSLLGLVPFDVALGLLAEVESTKFHLDTGIVGVRFLFDALSSTGHSDAALEVILQETYPGYAFEWNNDLETHATTLWELWDAPLEGPGMNSRNHIMDGSVDTWMHRHVGGISQEAGSTAYRQLKLHADVAEFFSPVRSSNASRKLFRSEVDDEVSFAWERHGGVVCEKAARGRPIELNCGSNGGVLSQFDFVSVGNPEGMCQGYAISSSCHQNASLQLQLEQHCLGKSRCVLDRWWDNAETSALETDRREFGGKIAQPRSQASAGHCSESHIVAAVRGVCSSGASYSVKATIPPHTAATIVVPTFATRSPQIAISGISDPRQLLLKSSIASTSTYSLFTEENREQITFTVTSSDKQQGLLVLPVRDVLVGQDALRLAKLHDTAGIPFQDVAAIEHVCIGENLAKASGLCAAALDGAFARGHATMRGVFV